MIIKIWTQFCFSFNPDELCSDSGLLEQVSVDSAHPGAPATPAETPATLQETPATPQETPQLKSESGNYDEGGKDTTAKDSVKVKSDIKKENDQKEALNDLELKIGCIKIEDDY